VLEEIDRDLGHITSIGEEHRDALWLLASAEQQRGRPIADRRVAARPQLTTRSVSARAGQLAAGKYIRSSPRSTWPEPDVALLGEVCEGRDAVRFMPVTGHSV
jgi:hypothetical protein